MMSIEVVTAVSRGPLGIRVRRILVMALGVCLTLVGILALTPLVMLVLLAIVLWEPSAAMNSIAKPEMLLLTIMGIASFAIGTRLRRGRRQLVLFLRRFGFEDASKALTFAAGTAVGRRWRLVTLDDAEIAPLGVHKRTRRIVSAGRWLLLAAVAWGVGYGLQYLHGGGAEGAISSMFDDMFAKMEARGDNVFAAFFGALIGTFIFGLLVLALSVTAIFVPTALAGSLALFSWRSWRAVRKAEESKLMEITSESDVDSTIETVLKRTRQIFAPRLVVIRVVDTLWKNVVRTLGGSASVVLVDVSIPSANLLWEVKNLKPKIQSNWILVGQEDQVTDWIMNTGTKSRIIGELRALLDGDTVLAYEGTERHHTLRFTMALRARLEQLQTAAAERCPTPQ